MVLGSDPSVRLVDILDERAVVLPLRGADKWEAIRALVNRCVEQGALSPEGAESALAAVLHREETMSTGLEHGIAIPHGATEQVDDIVAALGICPEGIEFNSLDQTPARIVLLMIIPKSKFQKHIRTLAAISRLLTQADYRQRIIDAASPAEALDAIRDAEKNEYL